MRSYYRNKRRICTKKKKGGSTVQGEKRRGT